MGVINKIFNGKLNLDTHPHRMPPGDYIDALNITRDAEGESKESVVSNIAGNTLVPYTLPAGTNKNIGKYEDVLRNRIYDFTWNSNGNHLVRYYDKATNTFTTLITDLIDTGNVAVLDFNPSKRINHVDIIYRDESEGDMVFWTDGNTSPKKMNVKRIIDGDYSVIKASFIEVAKMPFKTSPTAVYGSDTTRNANALRRKLFQFTARPVFDDFEKATFSTYSKIPLPIGFYGSDNDIDNNRNNFITISVETGDENVKKIEIAGRNNIANAWGDFVLLASLDKEELGIPNNSTYDFLFYNDAIYPPIDVLEAVQLHDWVPQLADAQVMANGNVPVYLAITENYDNYPVDELDVTITAANVTNVPPDTNPPAITYEQTFTGGGVQVIFTITGTIPTGTVYRIYAVIAGVFPPIILSEYTALPGDDNLAVRLGLHNATNVLYQFSFNPNYKVSLPLNSYILYTEVFAGPGAGGTISTEKTWMHNANYIFGIVYVDEQNRDMPGVTTYSNPVDSANDFLVTTPTFSLAGADVQTPVISASINHIPPAGAVRYYWVRRRLTYGTFMMYETCDFQDPSDGFLYFCLENINKYQEANSQFIYGQAPITTESRIQIIAGVTAGAYNGNLWTQDYQVLGADSIRTLTGGSSPADDRTFIKVKKPIAAVSPTYTANMLVMIYTPALNPTSLADSVYWEWGEGYDIYTMYTIGYISLVGTFSAGEIVTGGTSGATGTTVYVDGGSQMKIENVVGVFVVGETVTGGTSGATADIDTITPINYHRGMDQDQTELQRATFTWAEGDVYFHQRDMYNELLTLPYATDTLNIMDGNYSDFFNSLVNDNGRAQAIEVNARRQFNPVLERFGGEYQAGTNINQINRFYFDNFDEYDRGYGAIKRAFIDKRYMYVFQRHNVGVVPILQQIIKDTSGNPLEANSDILLNKITYPYQGQFGIGDLPESFAFGKGAKYFIDSNKAVVCRLSQDGITPLSILYECNAFFIDKLAAFGKDLDNGIPAGGTVYAGNPTVHGVFDGHTNKYIVALEEINRYNELAELVFHQDPFTLSFNETRDTTEGFESHLSFKPEMMGCLNNLFFCYKNGELWKHDSATFCNFFGVQYDAYIKAVFNDNPMEKKTFVSLAEIANSRWDCPEIETDMMSYGIIPQQSTLMNGEFTVLEGQFHTSFKKDSNSRGGKFNGSSLKGKYIIIKFKASDPSIFVYLNISTVKYITSPLSI